MPSKVEQDGENLVVTIPQEILDAGNLKPGDEVDIFEEDGKIVIEKISDE